MCEELIKTQDEVNKQTKIFLATLQNSVFASLTQVSTPDHKNVFNKLSGANKLE